jgi:uncharacterized protein YndB with AHSA1/START domain
VAIHGTAPARLRLLPVCIHASPERVWDLLTNPARLDWVGVKVVEAPAT